MSELRQFELTDFNDNSRLVCWLPNDGRLAINKIITLKEITGRTWVVTRVYKTVVERGELNRKWSVGGL